MIEDDVLRRARALQEMTMTQEAEVLRSSVIVDDMGMSSSSPDSVVGTTKCRVAPGGQRESVVAGRLIGVGTWRVTLPATSDVRQTDRLRIDGRVYEVLSILAPATFETARVCVCEESL